MQPRNFIVEKPWGIAECIFKNSVTEIWRNDILSGGESSGGKFHFHKLKYNQFYLEDGTLELYLFTSNSEEKKIVLTGDNPHFIVFPRVRHRFKAVEECILYEIYWTYCSPKDIKRDGE